MQLLYCSPYGSILDLFAVLELEAWPETVMEEFRAFLN